MLLLLNKHGQHLAQKEVFETYTSIVFMFSSAFSPSVHEVNPINADSGSILLSFAVLFNKPISVTPSMLFSVISLSSKAGESSTGRIASGVALASFPLLYRSALATDNRSSSELWLSSPELWLSSLLDAVSLMTDGCVSSITDCRGVANDWASLESCLGSVAEADCRGDTND